MQTFADKPKMQVPPTRSAVSGLWRASQKADWNPDSVKREPLPLGFDFSFARISVDPPKRAHDQPINGKGVQTNKIKEEMKVEPDAPEELADEVDEGKEVQVASDIGLNLQTKKVDDVSGGFGGLLAGKNDKVASGVKLGSLSQPDDGKVDADSFGTEKYDADFNGVSHSFAKKVCMISGMLDVTCRWGARNRGRKDVPSGTSAIVTAESWPDIKKDLTPAKDAPYKSPRKEYYSRDLTERHEIFHGKEDFDRTKSTGMGIVKASLEKNTVTPKNAATKIPKILKEAKDAVKKDVKDYYEGGGTDHDSYAGEIRAYLKGKPDYEALADAVEKHGKTLRIPRNTRRR